MTGTAYILVLMIYAQSTFSNFGPLPPSMVVVPLPYATKDTCAAAGKEFLTDVRVYQCLPYERK